MLSRFTRRIGVLGVFAVAISLTVRAQGTNINFGGLTGSGSTVYGGDSGPMSNTSSVSEVFDSVNPSNFVIVSDGTLSYTTGSLKTAAFTPSPATGPADHYLFQPNDPAVPSEGTVTITGKIPSLGISSSSVLASGKFVGLQSVQPDSGGHVGPFQGNIIELTIDPAIAAHFGTAASGSGTLTQNLNFPTFQLGSTAATTSFNGSQISSNLSFLPSSTGSIGDTGVPEPTSVGLWGMMTLAGLVGRRMRRRLQKAAQA